MTVKIRLNAALQQPAGNREKVKVNGTTVKQCLDDLIRQIPGVAKHIFNKDGSISFLILLNSEPLPDQDLNYPVRDNDELWLLSILSGG
jgi:molybdopterin converting factor small subunit